jgi:prophage antirepressor-like protein
MRGIPATHPKALPFINNVSVFENANFGQVRVVTGPDGEPWFVASDISKALGYERPANAVNVHCKKVNKISQRLESGQPPVTFNIIPESDVYRLIMRSNLPNAEIFQDWVTDEVLPSIRKRGLYATDDMIESIVANPDLGIKLLQELKQERIAKAEAQALAEAEANRAEYYRQTKAEIGSRREATSMATASAAVRKACALEDDLGIGRHYRQVKAIEWLRGEFVQSSAMYSQVGKKLTELSKRMGYLPRLVPDERYPNGVKSYHVDVIEAFRGQLRMDLNMLRSFRHRG